MTTSEGGFGELILWASKAAESLSISQEVFYSSLLDVGSGRKGYVLRYASSTTFSDNGGPFKTVVGIEVNKDLEPLTKLPKSVSIVTGDNQQNYSATIGLQCFSDLL